jgi:ABC-2 type transport system permease protein
VALVKLLRAHRYLFALVATAQKASFALRGAFALQVALMAVNNLLFFTTWWILLRRFPSAGGYTLRDMMLLHGVSATGFGLAVVLCGGMFQLGRHIGDGDLDALLCQPKSVLLRAIASQSQASGLGDIASGALLFAMSGYLRWQTAPLALLAVFLCGTMLVASFVVLQCAVFWLGRVEQVSRRLWEFVVTLSLYPPALFGGGMRFVMFTILPAALVSHVPVQLVRSFDWHSGVIAVAGTTLYVLFAAWLFARGLRRYESGSRFGVWA